MLFIDEKKKNDRSLYLTEYLASFWNPDAVRKVKETRERASEHKFADDKEFEEQVISGSFRDNPYVKAIQKMNEEELANNNGISNRRRDKFNKFKIPTDLSNLSRFIKG